MSIRRLLTVIPTFLCLFAIVTQAGTIPGSMPRETLVYSKSLDRIGINEGVEVIRRKVDLDGGLGGMTLDAVCVYAMVGYDILSWLTVFGTFGGSEAEIRGAGVTLTDFDDAGLKWSIGVNANLWHYKVKEPDFIAGRLSLRAVTEFSRYSADDTGRDIHWNELSLAFPFSHEMFADYGPHRPENMFSLAFYLGPGLSILDGSAGLPIGKYDFDEKESLAVVAGIEFYLARNFSIGCHGQYADDGRIAGVIQYHF